MMISVTQGVFVDLVALPWREWPAEAQSLARDVLGSERLRRRFLEELPGLRKGWLAAHVERLSRPLEL